MNALRRGFFICCLKLSVPGFLLLASLWADYCYPRQTRLLRLLRDKWRGWLWNRTGASELIGGNRQPIPRWHKSPVAIPRFRGHFSFLLWGHPAVTAILRSWTRFLDLEDIRHFCFDDTQPPLSPCDRAHNSTADVSISDWAHEFPASSDFLILKTFVIFALMIRSLPCHLAIANTIPQ